MVLTVFTGLDAAEDNQQKLEKAEEASRYDARRIAALEREVAYLRSVNRYKDAGTQTVLTPTLSTGRSSTSPTRLQLSNKDISHPPVDIKEYRRINAELAEARHDLEDTSKAHLALKSKCRYYKEKVKEWSDYSKRWHEKKGKAQNIINREEAISEKAISEKAITGRASSAPTQLTPSDVSVLPHAQQDTPSLGLSSPGLSKDVPSHGPEPIITTVIGADRVDATRPSASREPAQATSDDDPTQASDDEGVSENYPEPRLQDVNMLESRDNEESDSPVFVKVRPLKRKRERNEPSAGNVPKMRRNGDAPGTASKPVHVKSDPSSSSPLAKSRFVGCDDIHDSMDLDEVGSKTKTPRKHQRYRMDDLRSPIAPTAIDGPLSLHESLAGRDDALEEQDLNESQETRKDPGQSSILDEASCRQRGEEFAARLWRQQQARREQLEESQFSKARAGSQSPLDGQSVKESRFEISGKDDVYGIEVVDRQVEDFNQRIREAEHKKPEQSLPKTPKPVDPLMPNVRQDRGIETKDFGLLTPITTARAVTRQFPNQPREIKSHNCGKDHSVLQPKDANNQILPRTSELLAHEKAQCPPSRRDRGAAQIHTVLEDGEETPSSRKEKQGTTRSKGERNNNTHTTKQAEVSSVVYHRLGTLLAEPSPGRRALPTEKLNVPPRTEQRKSRTPSRDFSPSRKSPAKLPRHLGSSSKATPTISKAKKPTTYTNKPLPPALATLDLTSSDDPPPIVPDDEPLRSRPVHRLRREDFKINPSANQGIGYAYREVVRKRRERQCLPNCDRPDCCGDTFKKLIAIAGPFPRQNRGLFESSPPDEECSKEGYDYSILKKYMGDNFHAWSRMSDEEKKEEWGRAQVWDLSSRFGRHKATGRQRTPPGFWKVDVDSTQEIQEHREEADKMAREEVVERWREAMRPGGIWKFADE